MPSKGNKKGALDSEKKSRPAQRQKQDGGVGTTVTTGANVESETKTRRANTSSRNSSKSKEATSAGEQQVIGDDLTITCKVCDTSFVNEEDRLVECERCELWVCFECSTLTEPEYAALSRSNSQMHWFCNICTHSALTAVKSDQLVEERCKQYLASFREEYDTKVSNLSEDLRSFKESQQEKNGELEKRLNHLTDTVAGESVNEIRDRDRRLKNIILFNIPESDSEDPKMRMEDDLAIIQDLCKNPLKVNAMFTKVTRLGKIGPKERPLRATCESHDQVQAYSRHQEN